MGHVAQIEDGNWNERCQVKMAPTAEDVDQPSPSVLCQMPVVAAGHYSPLLKYQSPGSDNTHRCCLSQVFSQGQCSSSGLGRGVGWRLGIKDWPSGKVQGWACGYRAEPGAEVQAEG